MKKTEELFFLIKSLTPSEKRSFKVYSQRHELGGTKNNYVVLFEAIDKLEVYDEQKLIKKFSLKKQSELSTKKNQLFSKLLDCYRGNRQSSKANDLLNDTHFLLKKGIVGTAIQKLEKITNKPEDYPHRIVMDACHLFRYLITQYEGKDKLKKVERIQFIENNVLKEEVLLIKLLHIWDDLYALLSKEKQNAKLLKEEKLHEVKMKIRAVAEEDCHTFQTQKYFYSIQGGIALLENNAEFSLTAYKKLLNIYDSNPKYLQEDLERYIAVIHNYLSICGNIEEYDLLLEKLEVLKRMEVVEPLLRAKVFKTTINMELMYLANTYQYQKGLDLIPEIIKGLKKYSSLISIDHIIAIYYNIVCLYFLNESFKKGLVWCEKIQNLGVHSPRYDVQDTVHILLIISYYELDDIDELGKQIRRSKNYYKVHKRNDELLKKIIHLINNSMKVVNKKELRAIREAAHVDILDNCHNKIMGGEEVLMWLTSRITGKTIKEVAKEKLHLEPILAEY